MKVCVLLLCVCCVCWRVAAQSRTYLITAPLSFRLDAMETVLLQLFGFTDEVSVYVFLKTSMAPDHVVLAREVVTLNSQNHHQAATHIRIFPGQLMKEMSHVIIHVQSAEINQHLSVPISRTNGFLFIETDKPLYTPHQSVKVRAFSLNQELRPANRSVFLTFRDPDQEMVDIVEMFDFNNGIPSLQNPFRLPIKPKFGVWSIEASYSDDFTTTAKTDFEVKKYVLPSFSIVLEPEKNYISYGSFGRFGFKITARYQHGAPVANAEVFLRYGYVSGKKPPVIIPNSVSRERLSPTGEADVTVNMERILSNNDGPRDLNALLGKYLYIAALLQEDTGGLSQEVELASVKFVRSPYRLSLVSTPPFIKPGLPYNVQVLVKDHLDQPVNQVRVRVVEQQSFSQTTTANVDLSCPDSSVSQRDGLAVFICNTPRGASRAVLKFETSDPALPLSSQASLTLEAVAYMSPNQRYLYIDPPLAGHGLVAGGRAHLKVYSATPSYVPLKGISFLVLSKGKVEDFGNQLSVPSMDSHQTISFDVKPSMVPSIRLLVYYILYGEGTSELVADSVWLDVKDNCVNGLQTELTYRGKAHRPKQSLQMEVRTNQEGLVAFSAMDTALVSLRPSYKDPVTKVLRHIEHSDLGCGGGGGKDAADVFRLAGLTFFTNANAHPSQSSDACMAVVRPKRALTEEEKVQKAQRYGPLKICCEMGMRYIPKSVSCRDFAKQRYRKTPRCQTVFAECCEHYQQSLDQDHNLILGRNEMGADFDMAPTLVRSFFPENWLWEVQRARPGLLSVSRTLPDSLTTWQIRAIGMFPNGMCVAPPVQVPVSLPLSVDVPLPYQVVRGEQLELKGSVYNQQADSIRCCVTLAVGPAICLLRSQPAPGGAGLHSTPCRWSTLPAGGVGNVAFTLLGLEPGEHTLTFTLKTYGGARDILQKTLRVVPEGVRKEVYSGGRLDPQGLYGSEKRSVELKNRLPANVVPNTAIQRQLFINGEVLGEVMSVLDNPDGLRQLINLPAGSMEAELAGVLPLVHTYRYLETARRWDVLGGNIRENAGKLSRRIRDGVVGLSAFKTPSDSSYSMWTNREPSTWLTAQVIQVLALVDEIFPVDHQSLSQSLLWLIRAQQQDGSFRETSTFRPNRVMAAGANSVDQSVYLTSFVLMSLYRVTRIKDPILQLRLHDSSMESAANYISQHALGVQSVYVRAVATFALTLHDPNSRMAAQLLTSLERLAHQKGHPAVLRYWQESSVTSDWLRPDQSSGLTVETTAYVLLTTLLKGRIQYANPILTWLTQDQHYGEGFYSTQDIVLTLEAVTQYSRVASKATLNLDISVRYNRKGALTQVTLNQRRPVATPIQVKQDDDITVSTGYGSGVSNIKM
ncbi:complement C5 isoform X2 [Genypterus blacodes]|uniref:complement C5 isoform X2 n=1 Tax=Genypterus blacodes TaxID=154954 RepID=UPI003F76F762